MPATPAMALFGLFGSKDPPAPSATTLPYKVTFETGGNSEIETALKDASNLSRLQDDPPADGESLARRAQSDLTRLVDAQWGAGYYNASIAIIVGEERLTLGDGETALARIARAAERYRASAHVPVRIVAEPGKRFTFREVVVIDAATGAMLAPETLPPRVVKLAPGDPARAADILAAEARIVDHFRDRAMPFARAAGREPVVYHDRAVMDLRIAIARGPTAGIGDIMLNGLENLDPAVVRSFIYVERGMPYSPRELAAMRGSIGRIEAISGVRIREGKRLDAEGNLPLSVELTERPPRLIGGGAKFSTVDGPAINAYWAHRNLFGGGERLRLDAAVFFARRGTDTGVPPLDDLRLDDLGGRFTASFLKPALGGTRNDFLLDATAAREATKGYLTNYGNVTAAIRHRWSDRFSGQIGIEVEGGRTEDALGRIDYLLTGIPISLTYDSTDNPLEPTRGFKATAGVTPYPALFERSVGMTVGRFAGSAYYALDEEARYVLAGRIGLGSIVGAGLAEIPANRRFFAGGGGSVRGYRYRSLGPRIGEEPIGGRSLLEGSLEARIRVTDTIGIVPFVDAGTAFDKSFPDFGEEVRLAAGLGLRYYTGIGPIRVDFAVPINPGRGDPAYALYFGIGQAF